MAALMGSTWSLPNLRGAAAAEHEASNRGAGPFLTPWLFCPGSVSPWLS